jgi:hypothetical protein
MAAVVGPNESVTFDAGSNVASLFNTAHTTDTVHGSNGTVYMFNATANITGNNDLINFETSDDHATVSGNNDTVAFIGAGFPSSVSVAGTSETFKFQAALGQVTITGFEAATDNIYLSASDFGGNWTGLQSHMAQVGANTVITLDANNTITLVGVTESSMQSSHFHFG